MSRQKTKDYVVVLGSTRALMPAVAVRRITSDFERALWQAVAKVDAPFTGPKQFIARYRHWVGKAVLR